MIEVVRVKQSSETAKVAQSIAIGLQKHDEVMVTSAGQGATYIAIKAIAATEILVAKPILLHVRFQHRDQADTLNFSYLEFHLRKDCKE